MTRAEVLSAARDIIRWMLTLKRGIVTRGPSLLLFYGCSRALLRTPSENEACALLFRKGIGDGFIKARRDVARHARWA
jgi:hypothetical protein